MIKKKMSTVSAAKAAKKRDSSEGVPVANVKSRSFYLFFGFCREAQRPKAMTQTIDYGTLKVEGWRAKDSRA